MTEQTLDGAMDERIAAADEGAALARFRDLFEVLQDLIKRVADTDDPAIRHKRAQVRAQLVRLENDPTPISDCVRAARACTLEPVADTALPGSEPLPRAHWVRQEHWAPIAALTGVAMAISLFREPA